MRTSVTWLNDYLDPPATADEQAELLTNAGFPLDGKDRAENGEAWQEIEITSNRGDCLCHSGFAREIAAVSGRALQLPKPPLLTTTGPDVAGAVRITNEEPDLCPLYTGRVVRGVTVGPSPEWLQRRLIAAGHQPRNNLVDATNFVLFELGQPTHVFDLATLAGSEIRIRRARADEPFLPIGEGAQEIRLRTDDLVIADRDRAVAIAGVKGGALTAVRDTTRDVLIEAATFAPVTVRATSRALRVASDSAYRFERGVHPAEVDAAAERLVALILELAGGTRLAGSVRAGAAIPPPRRVAMRPERCRRILGVELSSEIMLQRLTALGFDPKLIEQDGDERIECLVPPRRLDIEREIDLIEEVCRTNGLRSIPVADTIAVRVVPIQPAVAARKAVKDLLVGLGFVECVTHTLVAESAAQAFLPPAAAVLAVDDERAGGEPTLRPSVLPSLLRVRRHNLDNGLQQLDLFESASVFHAANERHQESQVFGLIADSAGSSSAECDTCARRMRGTVERVARLLAGPAARVEVEPSRDPAAAPAWLAPAGILFIDGEAAGTIGMLSPATLSQFGLDRPMAAAELKLGPWLAAYPPDTRAAALPAFPGTDRDISAIVDEAVAWRDLVSTVTALRLADLESVHHVATYRGKQTGPGKKSVSMRLLFRAADRTLRSEEADQAIAATIAALRSNHAADIRTG